MNEWCAWLIVIIAVVVGLFLAFLLGIFSERNLRLDSVGHQTILFFVGGAFR